MVDHELTGIIEALRGAIERLKLAKASQSRAQIAVFEDEICMETRTLFTRFIDSVLWSGELEKSVQGRVRRAIEAGVTAVKGHTTDSADSIRLRLGEFDAFVSDQEKKLKTLSSLDSAHRHWPLASTVSRTR